MSRVRKPLDPTVILSRLAEGSVPAYRPDLGSCWVWTGSLNGGYGSYTFRETSLKVHRVVYEYLVGPIPDGLQLDHLCRNRRCANPSHLEPVTHAENMRRMSEARTHCFRGHEFTPENTRIQNAAKGRICNACHLERTRRWQANNRPWEKRNRRGDVAELTEDVGRDWAATAEAEAAALRDSARWTAEGACTR